MHIGDPMPLIRRALGLNIPVTPTLKYTQVKDEGFFMNYANCIVMKHILQNMSDEDSFLYGS